MNWEFLDTYLQNRAHNTQLAYRAAVKDWCYHLNTEPFTVAAWNSLINAAPFDAENYLGSLSRRPGMDYGGKKEMAANTIRLRVALLRRLYSILMACGEVKSNPFALIDVRHRKGALKRQAAIVPFESVPEFVRSPNTATPDGIRDRAFFALLFGAGLRISEAQKIRMEDVQVSPDGFLLVRLIQTKGADEETQVVAPWAAELVSKLVSKRKLEGADYSDYLLVRYRGQERRPTIGRVPMKTLYTWFRKWRDVCALPKNITPHSGRVTAISKLLAQGYEPHEVQEFSRHSDARMVLLYDRRRKGSDKNCGLNLKF